VLTEPGGGIKVAQNRVRNSFSTQSARNCRSSGTADYPFRMIEGPSELYLSV